jgi:archaeal cell division control protein 6
MKRNLLRADETLFRDRDVFEINYLPEEFSYRESQLKDLAFAVRPAQFGSRPLNTVLRGLLGTGKTTRW